MAEILSFFLRELNAKVKHKLVQSHPAMLEMHTYTHKQTGALTQVSHTPVTVCGG